MRARPDEHIVIVGAGHAGGRMAQHLRRTGFTGDVTLIGAEAELPYERPALSKELLHGAKQPADIRLLAADHWAEAGIELVLSAAAVGIDLQDRRLQLSDGRPLAFDRLIVATGGTPRRLQVPGSDDPRVVDLRTIDDATALARHLPALRRLVVIGGGVIGLEVAAAARQHGAAVTVIEAGPRLMARVGPPVLSNWLLSQHRDAGVDVRLGATTAAITPDAALTVHARDRAGAFTVEADLVLSAIGIAPAVDCLVGSGVDLTNGVAVDAHCRVPDLPIYAVGDVANTYSPLYGEAVRLETWRNAEEQPKALAEILQGRDTPYVEVPWMWTDQYERNVQVVGRWSDSADLVLRGEAGAKGASGLFVEGGVVTGAVLWDNGRDRRFVEKFVAARAAPDLRQLADATVALRSMV